MTRLRLLYLGSVFILWGLMAGYIAARWLAEGP